MKQMMRLVSVCLAFSLAIALSVMLVGCESSRRAESSGTTKEREVAENSAESGASSPSGEEQDLEFDEECEILGATAFEEGLAGVKYSDMDGNKYIGYIDQSGNVLFSVSSSTGSVSSFGNGYGYLETKYGGTVYMINREGTVAASVEDRPECAIDGLFVLREKMDSGESAVARYRIIGPGQTELLRLVHDESEESRYRFSYLGDGVLTYKSNNVKGNFYFAEADKMVEDLPVSSIDDKKAQVSDGYFVYYVGKDEENTGEQWTICVGTPKGDTKIVVIPDGFCYYPRFEGISNGIILLRDSKERLFVYDMEKDEFTKYTGVYHDMIDWDGHWDMEDGIIFLNLREENGRKCIGMISSDLKELCDPIQGENYMIGDGMLVVQSRLHKTHYRIYSFDGTEIGTIESEGEMGKEGDGLCFGGDGLILGREGDQWKFYHPDGTVAIEKIKHSYSRIREFS